MGNVKVGIKHARTPTKQIPIPMGNVFFHTNFRGVLMNDIKSLPAIETVNAKDHWEEK